MKWYRARKKPIEVLVRDVEGEREKIETEEGDMIAERGKHFIIKGVEGELYPIAKDIFCKTYDVIGEVEEGEKL